MLIQAKKGTDAKVVYPNGNVEESVGTLLVCILMKLNMSIHIGLRVSKFFFKARVLIRKVISILVITY